MIFSKFMARVIGLSGIVFFTIPAFANAQETPSNRLSQNAEAVAQTHHVIQLFDDENADDQIDDDNIMDDRGHAQYHSEVVDDIEVQNANDDADTDGFQGFWSLMSSLSFRYINDQVIREKYRGDHIYMGGMIAVQPEYNFTPWFALGLELGMGGVAKMVSEDSRSKASNMPLYLFLTFKFTYRFEKISLWGEFAFGVETSFGTYFDENNHLVEGKIADTVRLPINVPMRLRFGLAYHLTDDIGLGIQFGFASYFCLFDPSYFLDGGLYFVKRF